MRLISRSDRSISPAPALAVPRRTNRPSRPIIINSDNVSIKGAPEAMALAWINCWSPEALINNHVVFADATPAKIPDDWRFELTENWIYPGDEVEVVA